MLKPKDRINVRVIFIWPWNENTGTKQKQQSNGNRVIWLVCWTDTNACGFWLVKQTFGWTNFIPEELPRFDVILQNDWPIEHFSVILLGLFLRWENEESMFWSFIHWLIKQITNTNYQNHFEGQTKIAQLLCQLLDAWNVSKSAFRITLISLFWGWMLNAGFCMTFSLSYAALIPEANILEYMWSIFALLAF